jgi:hypothetical protein
MGGMQGNFNMGGQGAYPNQQFSTQFGQGMDPNMGNMMGGMNGQGGQGGFNNNMQGMNQNYNQMN